MGSRKKRNWPPVVLVAMVVLFGKVLAGCSSQPAMVGQAIPMPMTSENPIDLPEYQIRPGDELDIKFFYNPELNETVLVRPDGKISLQLVGELTPAGLTPGEFSKVLKQNYSQELRQPEITVIVRNFTGQQIYMGGEVEREGPVEYTAGMTALQAVIKAGGFKETAEPEEVIVIRRTKQNEIRPYRVDLERAYRAPYEADIWLRPDDVVFVSKSTIAEMNKFVKQYISDLLLFRGWGFSFRGLNYFTSINGN
ncbi:polysaccharide biosynthesis/export family protein [Nitrosococcus watsonii]|uniref:Polysaccharide export protein n=1 Tax=Nitrosococcus watsoni (strain C-113) TaxID=105559 RepID=D8KBF4_NITWC|nr:polysaccharide biosynthesis/export family protein [Nitrosococcus watsonii]ADJ29601.1 polysaccharide export protein [Nitrosococcus watsonii C-113]